MHFAIHTVKYVLEGICAMHYCDKVIIKVSGDLCMACKETIILCGPEIRFFVCPSPANIRFRDDKDKFDTFYSQTPKHIIQNLE